MNAEITKEIIIEYLKKIKKSAVTKRVGYMLEKHKGMDISKSFKMDRNYVFLNQFSKKYKYLNSKWMVKI